MLRRKRPSATTVASATSSSSCPAGIVSAEESLDELRVSLDRLEYLLAKISPSPPPKSSSGGEPTKETQIEDQRCNTSEEEDGVVGVLFHVIPTFMAVESADENEIIELLRRIAEIVVLCERRAGQLLAKYAAAAASSSSSSSNNTTHRRKMYEESSNDTNKQQEQQEKEEDEEEEMMIDYEAAALPYIAPFELFCERTILAKIVTLVTGIKQQQQTTRQQQQQQQPQEQALSVGVTTAVTTAVTKEEEEDSQQQLSPPLKKQQQQLVTTQQILLLLPPPTIATQAIQSISILIQNVSRATSLYFLLSNDIVNELIQLPIESYRHAAAIAAVAAGANAKKGGGGERQQQLKPMLLPEEEEELVDVSWVPMGKRRCCDTWISNII
jgi:hypothetical protein